MSVPMNADERALKDRAHALERKGKLEAATKVYLQLIARNNKDPALRLHHAELCDKLNRKDRAVASYLVAAHLLFNSGHAARARAAVNAGLRISPHDPGLLKALRALEPKPSLALVPKPPSYVDFEIIPDDELEYVPDDEALTEPHAIGIEVWEVSLSEKAAAPPRRDRTVGQRTPSRPAVRKRFG